jgi:hypothetical protein
VKFIQAGELFATATIKTASNEEQSILLNMKDKAALRYILHHSAAPY